MAEDSRIFLGLGSNIEDRYNYLKTGIYLLNTHSHIWVIDQSPVYQSSPLYYADQEDFYNMVIEIETNLEPLQLLDEIKKIEHKAGRIDIKKKNMPRTLDIDILAVGDLIIRTNILEIPHSKISERKFVLKPWNDIAPEFIITNINKNINKLLRETNDTSLIQMILILDNENSI